MSSTSNTPADPLLALADRPPETAAVGLPGGGSVTVRGLTVGEWERVEAAGGKAAEGYRATVVRYGVVREDGTHRYSDADVPALGRLSIGVVGAVYRKVIALSGLDAG